MNNDKHIKIFDTTLRDGQQCPGAAMSFEKNLEYARLAADLGVDVLEAGFPSASRVDFLIVQAVAQELSSNENSPIIAGLCQLRSDQVDKTIEALLPAAAKKKARLHVYLPVDPDLMPASLGDRADNKGDLIKDVSAFVKRAKDAGMEVEFSPEGYSRMRENFDFVTDLICAAIESGASIINCPDTIGGGCWMQGEEYFVKKMLRHSEIIRAKYPTKQITWSTHCHNDYGLAVENSLNAVFHGPCRQIEGCINGIGERAGNASLEQCILIIKHFAENHDPENPFFTKINTEHLQKISDFVGTFMLPRQPHWPIAGLNAAKHSSGGHTNAILKNPMAYQAYDPKETGTEITFLFGPLSGGNHAASIIRKAGYRVDDSEKSEIAQYIKDFYSTRRKGITDNELLEAYMIFRSPIQIEVFDYSRSKNTSTIHLTGKFFDQKGEIYDSCEGKDSALATLKRAIDRKFPGINIENYNSESSGSGVHATSLSSIIVRDNGSLFEGKGEDNDIEISAMKALISAVNKAFIHRHFRERTGESKL